MPFLNGVISLSRLYIIPMIILNVSQYEEALAIAISDPFVKEKVRTFTIRTWALSNEENNHLGMG